MAVTWCALNAHTYNYANTLRNRLTIAPLTSLGVTSRGNDNGSELLRNVETGRAEPGGGSLPSTRQPYKE